MAAESDSPSRRRGEPDVHALVIGWYPHEPDRVGELAVIPASGSTQVIGRGDENVGQARFFRPRPGRLEPTEPLASPALSRRQLEVRVEADGMHVRRVGQCPMRVNGVATEEGVLQPGDTLRFRQELVLLCTRRPARIAPLRHFESERVGPFGKPDALGILGESPAVWALREQIAFAAQSSVHVLVLGETGTGKELAARAVHKLSSRSGRPLVARNAATIPPGLVDAELFGNVRNYPNPGMAERRGLIGQADGGFLFLDEIGELPADLQAHLLRVLDSGGEHQRLGESSAQRSDFRLIAATNRDPTELKHDLLARLTVRIEVPPLAERLEDIPLLIKHLVLRTAETSPKVAARFAERDDGRARVRMSTRLIDELLRRKYQENTRGLEAILWAAMAASEGDTIEWTDRLSDRPAARSDPPAARSPRNAEPAEEEIRKALAQAEGNVARAAKALGLSSRYALYRVMSKLGIGSG
jgi:two-component system nitrogen regulation response regulator GlnG/two-component system response regulator HydG